MTEPSAGGQPEAIQIIETKDGPNGSRVLHYKENSKLGNILKADDVKNLPILVYSVTGKTRGGKSFLLNLMYKYLDAEGQPNWMEGVVPNVFDFSDGIDSMTKGLWLCSRIFRQTLNDGSKVGIMLMDNQGLFDGEVTGGESVAMSGVSTILSHVQMFNMKEKITTNDLEQIMLHLVPENQEHQISDQNTIGSSLMFVVRDFAGGKKIGFGLSNGRRYIAEEQKRGTQEYQSMWADQSTFFHKIDCMLFPHPGLEIMTEEFTQSPNLQGLDDRFVSEISAFLNVLFAPENLIPRSGGLTGLKMEELLSKVDGEVADKNLSYYNMYIERINHFAMQTAVANFNNILEISEDLYKAKENMEETLSATMFKGQTADEFSSNLRETLEGILNLKVVKHLVAMYKASDHTSVWEKVNSDLGLLVGSPEEVKQRKDTVVQECATEYYSKLAQEEITKFKDLINNANSTQFYNKMSSLRIPNGINLFSETCIRPCADFEGSGGSTTMLNNILHQQQVWFGNQVNDSILSNMYKIKEHLVQEYRSQLTNQNVHTQNAELWRKLKSDIGCLEFQSEAERIEHTNAIAREIAPHYYGMFREQVYNQMHTEMSALSDQAFYRAYETYRNINALTPIITTQFPEFDQFRSLGLTNFWEREKELLKTLLQKFIIPRLDAEIARQQQEAIKEQMRRDAEIARQKLEAAQEKMRRDAEIARQQQEAAEQQMKRDAEIARLQQEAAQQQMRHEAEIAQQKLEATQEQMRRDAEAARQEAIQQQLRHDAEIARIQQARPKKKKGWVRFRNNVTGALGF